MAVLTKSVLVPAIFLLPDEVRRARELAIQETVRVAEEGLRGADVTVRDMLPSDLGETNEIWADQTGTTANAWENTHIASQSIANERFVGVYGLVNTSQDSRVVALRFTIGSALRAQWSLFPLDTDDQRIETRTGIALSPWVVKQNQQLTIEQYISGTPVRIGSTHIAYLGVTVEKVGRVLSP